MASKNLYKTLSSPSCPGPHELSLRLGRFLPGKPTRGRSKVSPKALRWYEKRIKRYTRIFCNFDDATMLEREDDANDGTSASTLPPLLPSLLGACASSAALTLGVLNGQGGNFLALSSGGVLPGLGPDTSSFWANMKQHLTDLCLSINPMGGEVQWLGSLNRLTALKRLKLRRDEPHLRSRNALKLRVAPSPCHEMLEAKLMFKLPELVELIWWGIQPPKGELVLIGPKLTKVYFREVESLGITVENAALEELTLIQRERIQFMLVSPQDQLKKLRSLEVEECKESGRHLIQDFDLMRNLKRLVYHGFPATCMPTSFHEGLEDISLAPLIWTQDLPSGLKGLRNLKTFAFRSNSWDKITLSNMRRPSADILPIENLNMLQLGDNYYMRQPDGTLQLLDGNRLHDTPHGQYLAGLRPQVTPGGTIVQAAETV